MTRLPFLFLIGLIVIAASASADEQDRRVAMLIEQLKERSPRRVADAAKMLGDLGPEAKAAVPALIELPLPWVKWVLRLSQRLLN